MTDGGVYLSSIFKPPPSTMMRVRVLTSDGGVFFQTEVQFLNPDDINPDEGLIPGLFSILSCLIFEPFINVFTANPLISHPLIFWPSPCFFLVMASYPRSAILSDHSTFHVTWQCHNQKWLLKKAWAKKLYYQLLLKYKDRYQVQIHAYCFMDNHPHLTGQFQSLKRFSDFFRVVNSCFAKIYNRKTGRKGQVVMNRFKSVNIETENHLLNVMQYLDLNPKRAKKFSHPSQNDFSSYAHYALGKPDELLTPPQCYLQLGLSDQDRQEVYRGLIEQILKNDWKEKKPYSSLSFIGNPKWVVDKTRALKEIARLQRAECKKRYKAKFG